MMPSMSEFDWYCLFQHHCTPLLLFILLIISDFLKGVSLSKKEPAHFVSVFNKQQKEAKMLSRFKLLTIKKIWMADFQVVSEMTKRSPGTRTPPCKPAAFSANSSS